MDCPSYVDDGRACRIVRVSDLESGDVILGWNGEPFTLGVVENVTKYPMPSFGTDVRYAYRISYSDGRPASERVGADEWRRIAARANGAE